MLSPRQAYLAQLGQRDNRIVVVFGPARAGKTFGALEGFFQWAGRAYSGYDFALCAKSKNQLNFPVLFEMHEWCSRHGLHADRHPEGYYKIPAFNGGFNRFWPLIVPDGEERADKRSRGPAYAGVYADEFNTYPKKGLDQLKLRLMDTPGSKLVLTANPEGSSHWGYTDYALRIDQGKIEHGEHHTFSMVDNPNLDMQEAAALAATITSPHMFDRMILGKHVDAGGLVHQLPEEQLVAFDPTSTHVLRYEVGLDWARIGVTAAVLVAYTNYGWHIVDEYWHNGRVSGVRTIKQHARKLLEWIDMRNVSAWAFPHDAQGLSEEVGDLCDQRKIRTTIIQPCYDIETERIDILNGRIMGVGPNNLRLFVDPKCRNLRRVVYACVGC